MSPAATMRTVRALRALPPGTEARSRADDCDALAGGDACGAVPQEANVSARPRRTGAARVREGATGRTYPLCLEPWLRRGAEGQEQQWSPCWPSASVRTTS